MTSALGLEPANRVGAEWERGNKTSASLERSERNASAKSRTSARNRPRAGLSSLANQILERWGTAPGAIRDVDTGRRNELSGRNAGRAPRWAPLCYHRPSGEVELSNPSSGPVSR
ncbi:hypothetical protein MTP99_007358 [Tenebrio molitor]|nr:hypothetical protein MTP99_007358 [Tenebrio molitor]